jgi:hypothetical protein
VAIRGTYGSPNLFWKKGLHLKEYGINAIFVHSGAINEQLMKRALAEGVQVYAEFATLNGKRYVKEHPEAWPINEKGERAAPATWFMGICPTNPDFKKYRMDLLKDLLQKYQISGVWMDYLHWHAQFEDPNPIFPETCFCKNCLDLFQSTANIEIPNGSTAFQAKWILTKQNWEWRDWRCSIINGWAKDIKKIIKENRADVLLGNYQCPWRDDEFDGARRKNLGLDLDQLALVVDVFSPMVYHGRMGRSVQWVKEYVEWLCKRLKISSQKGLQVWPIVQAHDDPEIISVEDFEKVMVYGTSSEANGIMMFTFNSVAENDAKLNVLNKLYLNWAK